MQETKTCTQCQETKPLTDYHKDPRNHSKTVSICKVCRRTYNKSWRIKNPNKVRQMTQRGRDKRRLASYKAKYGITLEQLNQMMVDQNYRCRLCKRQFDETGSYRPVVDHDHKTGIVRGLLHNNCNSGLGYFEDDPNLLESAWAYISAYRKRSGLY